MADVIQAKEFFMSLTTTERWDLGDVLVLGTFDWGEWGLPRQPSGAFMRALDYERTLWEQTR